MTNAPHRWRLIVAVVVFAASVSAHAQLEIQASVPKAKYKVGDSIPVLVLLKNVSSGTIHMQRVISGGFCPDVSLFVESVKPKLPVVVGGCIGGGLNLTPEMQKSMDNINAGPNSCDKVTARTNSWSIALEPGYVYGTTVFLDAARLPQHLPHHAAILKITAVYSDRSRGAYSKELAADGFHFALGVYRSNPVEVQIVDR